MNSGRKARLAFRDGNRCFYCGSSGIYPRRGRRDQKGLTIDHVIPTARGGSNEDENLVLACRSCNIAKGDKLLSEWQRIAKIDVCRAAPPLPSLQGARP